LSAKSRAFFRSQPWMSARTRIHADRFKPILQTDREAAHHAAAAAAWWVDAGAWSQVYLTGVCSCVQHSYPVKNIIAGTPGLEAMGQAVAPGIISTALPAFACLGSETYASRLAILITLPAGSPSHSLPVVQHAASLPRSPGILRLRRTATGCEP